MALRHLGIITQRCVHWHRFLAPSVRNHYDIEDMISEVVVHVLSRSSYHDASRGRESTFVWWMADNKCKWILEFWQKKMRAACETVELTDIVSRTIPCANTDAEYSESLNAFERVIEESSDAVLDLLAQLLTGRLTKRNIPSEVIVELRTTAERCNASMEDFRRVLQYV